MHPSTSSASETVCMSSVSKFTCREVLVFNEKVVLLRLKMLFETAVYATTTYIIGCHLDNSLHLRPRTAITGFR